jgi:hypothetical protein
MLVAVIVVAKRTTVFPDSYDTDDHMRLAYTVHHI